jgi:AraC-like DNA-binding protein
MAPAHRHDDVEVDVCLDGRLSYVLGGRVVARPAGSTAALGAAALLEVEAWLRRRIWAAGRTASAGQPGPADGRPMPRDVAAATAMARDIALNFRDPVTISAVAGRAHLSPGHAMTVFRQVVGTTMGSCLGQCRVAEAQRLLITTDATTAEVGARSGCASQSAFYESSRAVSGQTPAAYRRAVGPGTARRTPGRR